MTTTEITTTVTPSGDRAHDVTVNDRGIVTTTTGVLLGELVDMKRRGWEFHTVLLGRPLPYGTKVAARYIARLATDTRDPGHGTLNAVNHNVAGYMSGLVASEWPRLYYCATCGNPEDGSYPKHCCTPDNMITDTTEGE